MARCRIHSPPRCGNCGKPLACGAARASLGLASGASRRLYDAWPRCGITQMGYVRGNPRKERELLQRLVNSSLFRPCLGASALLAVGCSRFGHDHGYHWGTAGASPPAGRLARATRRKFVDRPRSRGYRDRPNPDTRRVRPSAGTSITRSCPRSGGGRSNRIAYLGPHVDGSAAGTLTVKQGASGARLQAQVQLGESRLALRGRLSSSLDPETAMGVQGGPPV